MQVDLDPRTLRRSFPELRSLGAQKPPGTRSGFDPLEDTRPFTARIRFLQTSPARGHRPSMPRRSRPSWTKRSRWTVRQVLAVSAPTNNADLPVCPLRRNLTPRRRRKPTKPTTTKPTHDRSVGRCWECSDCCGTRTSRASLPWAMRLVPIASRW